MGVGKVRFLQFQYMLEILTLSDRYTLEYLDNLDSDEFESAIYHFGKDFFTSHEALFPHIRICQINKDGVRYNVALTPERNINVPYHYNDWMLSGKMKVSEPFKDKYEFLHALRCEPFPQWSESKCLIINMTCE